jgi:hypothetical protein
LYNFIEKKIKTKGEKTMKKEDKKNIVKLLSEDVNVNDNLSKIEKEIFKINLEIEVHKVAIEKMQNKIEIEKLKKENLEDLKLMLQSKLKSKKNK